MTTSQIGTESSFLNEAFYLTLRLWSNTCYWYKLYDIKFHAQNDDCNALKLDPLYLKALSEIGTVRLDASVELSNY